MNVTLPQDIFGIWPPLLLPWDRQWKLDLAGFDAGLEHLIAGKPQGIYTLDTASEFFTLEFDDWRPIAHRFALRARHAKLPLGLGCTWTNMEGALHRLRVARDLGMQTAHLSPPYWLPLNEAGLLRFMAEVQKSAGHVGVILYAPPHGQLKLTARLYRRIVEEAPCVIGSKTMGEDVELIHAVAGHSHFTHESHLAARAADGARGVYSFMAGASIRFMTDWWAALERGDRAEAASRHKAAEAVIEQGVLPLRERGIVAGAIDKAMAQIGGGLSSRLVRPPYESAPDDLFDNLRGVVRREILDVFEC